MAQSALARAILLRSGDARDVALVERVMAEAFDPKYGEAWTRGQCLGVLALPGVRLTIAEIDGAVVGFAMIRAAADEAELLLLAVSPDRRRHGVGTALLRAVEAECVGGGIATLHLEVRAGNAAVKLYAARGFAKVGERRAYYRGASGQAYDAHTYWRALT